MRGGKGLCSLGRFSRADRGLRGMEPGQEAGAKQQRGGVEAGEVGVRAGGPQAGVVRFGTGLEGVPVRLMGGEDGGCEGKTGVPFTAASQHLGQCLVQSRHSHTRVEWIPGFKEQRTSTYRRVHTCAHTRTRTHTSIALGPGTAPALSDPLYLPSLGFICQGSSPPPPAM